MPESYGEMRSRMATEQHARYWKRVDDEEYFKSLRRGRRRSNTNSDAFALIVVVVVGLTTLALYFLLGFFR